MKLLVAMLLDCSLMSVVGLCCTINYPQHELTVCLQHLQHFTLKRINLILEFWSIGVAQLVEHTYQTLGRGFD